MYQLMTGPILEAEKNHKDRLSGHDEQRKSMAGPGGTRSRLSQLGRHKTGQARHHGTFRKYSTESRHSFVHTISDGARATRSVPAQETWCVGVGVGVDAIVLHKEDMHLGTVKIS